MTFEKSPKMRARMGKQLQIAHQMVKGPNPFGAPGFSPAFTQQDARLIEA